MIVDNLYSKILEAHDRIRPHVLRTPLIPSPHLSRMTGADVYLKMESEQYTNSFKVRGATNKLLGLKSLSAPQDGESRMRVVTASTGNHAQGVARAMQLTGIAGTIFLPENPDPSKLAALEDYDVDLRRYGTDPLATEMHAKAQAADSGAVWVSPYNDPDIIAGQGTIGLELAEQLASIDEVFVTVGGGGLIAGIATCLSHQSPRTRVVGCQPENAADMYRCVEAGSIIEIPQRETLSDGSAGGVEPDSITFPICSSLVDAFTLVTEEEIKSAMRLMIETHHKIIEGAAGVALAAFLKNSASYRGKSVVVVVCGANISTEKLKSVLV